MTFLGFGPSLASRIRNQPGWNDFAGTVATFERIVTKSLSEIAERPAELWSVCASLGAFAEQDAAASRRIDSFVMPLEPDGKRVLTDVLATAAVLARRFHSVRVLDEELREFQSLPEPIEAAARLILTAVQQRVLAEQSATTTVVELAAPMTDGPQSKKAHGRGLLSVRNLALTAIGLILTGYLGEFGVEIAQSDPLLQRAKNWVVGKEKDLLETFEGAPTDTQAAVREALRRAKPRGEPSDIDLVKKSK